jgi:hypothetical protein
VTQEQKILMEVNQHTLAAIGVIEKDFDKWFRRVRSRAGVRSWCSEKGAGACRS